LGSKLDTTGELTVSKNSSSSCEGVTGKRVSLSGVKAELETGFRNTDSSVAALTKSWTCLNFARVSYRTLDTTYESPGKYKE